MRARSCHERRRPLCALVRVRRERIVILLIDNYDSFTFNLYQYFEEIGARVAVFRHDAITVDDIEAGDYERIVISPGPKEPRDAGVSLEVVRRFSGRLPLLGVCLGHQCIVEAFGGRIVRAPRPVHGKASDIGHDGTGLFAGLPTPLAVGRYHSLVAEESSFPDVLEVTSRSADDDVIMAVSHRDHPTVGVQFHPESILTAHGHALLRNFLRIPAPERVQ